MKIQEYKLKYTNRALMIFERLAEKPFQLLTLTDQYVFFYSVLIANNKDFKITFDEFIDILDEEPESLLYLVNWLTKELDIQSQFTNEKKRQTEK